MRLTQLAAITTFMIAAPTLFVPSSAEAKQAITSQNYLGCYSDAHASTCFTVPYVLAPGPIPTVNFANGGPLSYAYLFLGPGVQLIPIYQVFPPGFDFAFEDGHIDGPSGFEPIPTHQTTLPTDIAIRFAEVVNCPNTGIYLIPICGAFGDPAITTIHNDYVSDIRVSLTAIPEPTTRVLLLLGMASFGVVATLAKRGRRS